MLELNTTSHLSQTVSFSICILRQNLEKNHIEITQIYMLWQNLIEYP